MRKFALLAILIGVLVVGIMGTTQAAPAGGLVFNGAATLSSGFPCTGSCHGTAAFKGYGGGVDTSTKKAFTCVGCNITSTYTYNEPGGSCLANKVPGAPLGTAQGTLTTYAKPITIVSTFSWTRVGITAVVLLKNPTGVSVAGFVPPSKCTPTTAKIAGIAILA